MKPGDIVLIRFPQTDLHLGKLRPALIIAKSPEGYEDFVLLLITSRLYQAIPDFDDIIQKSDGDYTATGLKTSSVIRLSRITSVDSSVINACLGEISTDRLHKIKDRLIKWLE